MIAVLAYFFIYNYRSTASFLSESERQAICTRLKADSDSAEDEPFTWRQVREALTDYKCWMYGLGFHTLSLPLYTLSLFLPTKITDLGYTAAQAQLLTVPPYAVATIVTIVTAVLSEKTRQRSPYVLASSSVAIFGYIILLAAPSTKPGLSYAGTILAATGIYPGCAIVLSWAAANVSAQTKRATATAMTITIGNLGAVLGTQLYRPATSPRWYLGHAFSLGYLVASMVVVSTLWVLLTRENERKRTRESTGPIECDEDARWIFQT